MLLTATFSSLAFVLSTFVYFPQMAPFQHCINVITAVFLGPWYGTLAALVTGILRMMIGRSILAITGAIFGAFLAGVFYKYTKKFYMALIGEVIGTGIISAIVSYPIMKYVYGIPLDKFYYYIPFFLPSSLIGSFLGFLILRKLRKLEKF
ncbi:MAG: energy coupling factor transporter S component ThiW [Tissierellia bacterium]|nr:energy coupling factor transporter S component ThiW [Tissierellia bacterium]